MLLLNDSDVEKIIGWKLCEDAVREAMIAHARGKVIEPNLLHADCPQGEFHVKTGGLLGERALFGAKINGGFFGNPARSLPSIQGVIYVADAETGTPLAVLDSIRISRMRTAAASLTAARHLANPKASTMAVIGTGSQALAHVDCFREVFSLSTIRLWGRSQSAATRLAEAIQQRGLAAEVADSPDAATEGADIVVSATGSRSALLTGARIQPGTFIAAVGTDSPGKQEWDAKFVAGTRVVTDITAQCVRVGEIQHALAEGLMQESDIWLSAGELLDSKTEHSPNVITLYDSTGTALQDVAVGAAILEGSGHLG